jgi:hypothetical protein
LKTLRENLIDRISAKLDVKKPITSIDIAALRSFRVPDLEKAVEIHAFLESTGRTVADLVKFIKHEKLRIAEYSRADVERAASQTLVTATEVKSGAGNARRKARRAVSRNRLLLLSKGV